MTLLAGLTPWNEMGLAVAVLLIVTLRLVVPAERRRCVKAPLFFLVGYVLCVAVRLFLPIPQPDADSFIPVADKALRLSALALLLLSICRSGYLLLRYTVLERRGVDQTLPGIFRDIIQVGLYAVVALFVLHAAGVEPGSLLTTSALLTAVIGLSLQDTLGNLFAGLAIQAQQPFDLGDWVQFDDDEDHIGEVLEINWRATRLLTIDRIEVTVPNNLLAKAPIRNYSKPARLVRRSSVVVAPDDAPPARVHRILARAVLEVEGVRQHPPPDIQTIGFGERGVEYRVRYFIEAFDQREVIDSRVRDRMWYALRRSALPIPAPQRRITMVEQNAATRERDLQSSIVSVEKALQQVPFLAPLPSELLHELAIHTERRLYAQGELVIQQGDYGEEFFIVERGQAEVVVDSQAGFEHVASVGPAQFFGEMSLMTGEERKATVRAETEVAVLVVSKEALAPLLEAAPEVAREISGVLAAREHELVRHSQFPSRHSNAEASERRGELLARIRQFFSL